MSGMHVASRWFEEHDGTVHWRCSACGVPLGVTDAPRERIEYHANNTVVPDRPDAPCIPLPGTLSLLDQLGYEVTEAARAYDSGEASPLYEKMDKDTQYRNQAIGAAVFGFVIKTLVDWRWLKIDAKVAERRLGVSGSDLASISQRLNMRFYLPKQPVISESTYFDTVDALVMSTCRKLGMSQEEFIEALKLAPDALAELEDTGASASRLTTLQTLAQHLGTSYEYLCFLKGFLPRLESHPLDRMRVVRAYDAFYRTLHPSRRDATIEVILQLVGTRESSVDDTTAYTLGRAHHLVQESLADPAKRDLLLARLHILLAETFRCAVGLRSKSAVDPEEESALLRYAQFRSV